MAQQPRGAIQLKESAERLINEYGLEAYAERIREVAQDAAQAVMQEQGSGQNIDSAILQRGKTDLRDLLLRRQEDELVGGKLGRMQLYKIWDAEKINGNEWLFYPYRDATDPHVSWVVGQQEIHVKFDPGRGQTPVTLYYTAALTFDHVGRYGGQPTFDQRTEADQIIQKWKASMLRQANLRRAISEFLS